MPERPDGPLASTSTRSGCRAATRSSRSSPRTGIGTSVHFIPVHQFRGYAALLGDEECAAVPVTDRVADELLSLPLYPGLTDAPDSTGSPARLARARL